MGNTLSRELVIALGFGSLGTSYILYKCFYNKPVSTNKHKPDGVEQNNNPNVGYEPEREEINHPDLENDLLPRFTGICKKKVRENFGYLKLEIDPAMMIDELETYGDVVSRLKSAELREITSDLRKADAVLKHVIRGGERHSHCFLECFQSENIGARFVLQQLLQFEDKKIPLQVGYRIDRLDIHSNKDLIIQELDASEIIDPLLEYYLITLDHHDMVYKKNTRRLKNKELLNILFEYNNDDWIPGFVHVLEKYWHKNILQQIQHHGQRVLPAFSNDELFRNCHEIRLKFIDHRDIEIAMVRSLQIDLLCQQFGNLQIIAAMDGSILILVQHNNQWNKLSDIEKVEQVKIFMANLMEGQKKVLKRGYIGVYIEVGNVLDVDVLDSTSRWIETSKKQRDIEWLSSNWTYLVEELQVYKILENFMDQQAFISEDRKKILSVEGKKNKADEFLQILVKKELTTENGKLFIDGLVATGQTKTAERLRRKPPCCECLRRGYRNPENWKILLEELSPSIMLQTVRRFGDRIPLHIRRILSPEYSISRTDRIIRFMQYTLLHDDILLSFENILALTDDIKLIVDQDCVACGSLKELSRSVTMDTEYIPRFNINCCFIYNLFINDKGENSITVISTGGKPDLELDGSENQDTGSKMLQSSRYRSSTRLLSRSKMLQSSWYRSSTGLIPGSKPSVRRETPRSLYAQDLEIDSPKTSIHDQDQKLEVPGEIVDGMILHAEEDAGNVTKFIRNIKAELPDLDIKLCSFHEFASPGMGHFESTKKVFKACRYLFVFLTEDFIKAKFENFLQDMLLKESIMEEEKNARLIPVQVEPGVMVHALEGIVPLKYYMYLEKRGDSRFCRVFEKIIINGREKF